MKYLQKMLMEKVVHGEVVHGEFVHEVGNLEEQKM